MRVSQVLHKMDRYETVRIIDSNRPIDEEVLFEGNVKDVHRDSPLLSLGVDKIMAIYDEMVIDVGRQEKKRSKG